jgi:hypothetical protein
MRIGGTTIPTSQALTPLTPRGVAPDSSRRERSAPDRPPEPVPPAADVRRNVRERFVAPTPNLSKRGQRAVEAYTQHDVIERRAQYATLLGVDVYV